MAASRRSPLMRDQWRIEDDRVNRPSGTAHLRRRISPPLAQSGEHSRGEIRIRGRATTDAFALDSHPSTEDKGRSHKPGAKNSLRRSRSPRRDSPYEQPKRYRERSHERVGSFQTRREEDLIRGRRRHSHNRSSGPASLGSRRDSHRPPEGASRADRPLKPDTRRRARANSPLKSSRGGYHPSGGLPGDSYTPVGRPHSRSPKRRPRDLVEKNTARHRSRSREPKSKYRRSPPTPPRRRRSPPRPRGPRLEREAASTYRPRGDSRSSFKRRRGSPSPSFGDQYPSKRDRSRSPLRPRRSRRRSQERDMQHPQVTSPGRPIPSFDDLNLQHNSNMAQPFSNQATRGGNRQMRPPRVDTRQPYASSPQWTPTSSHHGSPHSASSYNQGRGGWGNQPQSYYSQPGSNAYSPPPRQDSYPPQQSPRGPFIASGPQSPYATPQPAQHSYQGQTYRGAHANFRGNGQGGASDRRFSGPGTSPPYPAASSRGGRGGHYPNLQWTASSNSRGRSEEKSTHDTFPAAPPRTDQNSQMEEDDNLFRPSKEMRVEDQTANEDKAKEAAKEGSKISFAFSKKAPPTTTTKPPADLTQRIKEPARKDVPSDGKSGPREDKATRFQRQTEDRFRSRDDRYSRDVEYNRDWRRSRAHERSPEPRMETQVMKRKRPKRTLSPSLAESTSVYYRKPGNESVVGSGTYGKVFKAIHVYTRGLAALKKIRMDGEKDGFPVTAVREIKLLQSLKHENVVSLQEVMVEHNDCFMVFEYLSHDLTGLLNHPTFKLEHAHKKHLGKQLFEGLNYLHRRGVLHRDIKAANILVSSSGQLKLADFGLARFYSKRGKPDYTNRVITIWYRSPELLLGETQYGPAVDIWSAACVMIEIFTRHAIFPGDGGEINQLDKIYNVLGTPARSDWPGLVDMAWFELLRPTERKPTTFVEKYQERLTPAAFELLAAMFSYDPSKRPTATEVLAHPYFESEEPAPREALELKDLHGDWHEFESKALRKENERKSQEARRAARNEEHEKEKAKRRASGSLNEREPKRAKPDSNQEMDSSR